MKASQIINTVNHLEKKGINVDSIKNKLLLKSQQRFKSGRRNVFTEKINKVTLSLNDDKRIQSIDTI